MKTLTKTSFIQIVGKIWMPNTTAASRIKLSKSDIENMADYDTEIDHDGNEYETTVINRNDVENWLCTHTGDFSSIIDFYADIELPDGVNIIIEWENEENECTYNDCMYPDYE